MGPTLMGLPWQNQLPSGRAECCNPSTEAGNKNFPALIRTLILIRSRQSKISNVLLKQLCVLTTVQAISQCPKRDVNEDPVRTIPATFTWSCMLPPPSPRPSRRPSLRPSLRSCLRPCPPHSPRSHLAKCKGASAPERLNFCKNRKRCYSLPASE